MKNLSILLLVFVVSASGAIAQNMGPMQYYNANDKTGLNTFEAPKTTDVEFDGLRVRIGGSNTLQFQALTQSNAGPFQTGTDPETGDPVMSELSDLAPNFNLATSNLDLDVQLHNGLRMHLRTYLSSRHHSEAWVKGGYMQVDRLDFIREGLFSNVMDRVSVKVGHMEVNYGDAHFRRTDNGMAMHNPFVGNYIMDSFTTEVAGEVYYQHNGLLAMVGLTNGKLNQSTVKTDPMTKPSIVGKLGFDRQFNPDLRFRLTGSVYASTQSAGINLYTGDRAGSRYYDIMEANRMSGRYNPEFSARGVGGEITAIMINPFVKFQGLEFFGLFEHATGGAPNADNHTVQQYGAELLYRFGSDEDFYFGGRYNLVAGDRPNGDEIDISRINIGGGWFLTDNVMTKVEYVTQEYNGFSSGMYEDGKFNGFMLEAVISF